MSKVVKGWDWDDQLAVGKRGEAFILAQHDELEPARDGERRWDLEQWELLELAPVRRVEVKCDTYDPRRTPNFFCERYTRCPGKLLDGGPWRALAHGVTDFCYLFINGQPPEAYWFNDLPALCKRLDELATGLKVPMRAVQNQNVRAEGYVVPRKLLEDLYVKRTY
jgi:hypothetical protein